MIYAWPFKVCWQLKLAKTRQLASPCLSFRLSVRKISRIAELIFKKFYMGTKTTICRNIKISAKMWQQKLKFYKKHLINAFLRAEITWWGILSRSTTWGNPPWWRHRPDTWYPRPLKGHWPKTILTSLSPFENVKFWRSRHNCYAIRAYPKL
jgi:hypothetical protein